MPNYNYILYVGVSSITSKNDQKCYLLYPKSRIMSFIYFQINRFMVQRSKESIKYFKIS